MNTMDENDQELKSPIKRLGSTRKLLVFNNIRLQLNEQLRCLDLRMEAQVALVSELQDFFRRRGELELDYSKNLDKLAKSLHLRHKEQKQKDQWTLFSSYACWQQLVTQTRNLSRDHVALSEIYSTHLVSRLAQVMEDTQRIYKKCREIGYETHEEILRVLHELHTTMKTYHSYQSELRQAESKLRSAETQRTKLEQSMSQDKLERKKKYKLLEKEVQKRKSKYTDAKVKALKARNEYLLCLEASNTTIHKYFVDDLSDLIDCMDFGFHNCITRALLMHVSAEEGRQKSIQLGMDNLTSCVGSLDSRLDKQRFLEFNHSAFMIPKKIEFQGQKTEEQQPLEPEIQKVLHQEMESRLNQLQQRVTNLRAESEEVWKTLETAESTLLEMLNAKDYDCSAHFGDNPVPVTKPSENVSLKIRADRQETEEFYLTKFREYLLGSSKIARLDAKQQYIRQHMVVAGTSSENGETLKLQMKTPRRKRIGRLQAGGHPKLFGGSLEEYLEATNQDIPLIIKSCIRVINLYGLHHQGIFRVSGSQVEINNFRECFERGEDPLADMTDASDINSVAGVLKLYLRELREPLFPIIYFEQFMELSPQALDKYIQVTLPPSSSRSRTTQVSNLHREIEPKTEFVSRIRELICSLPRAVMVVMRYIFAFLNHLSEFSDENMMDPYNLAICFGPTLVPVPEDKDQVQYQNQVNDLIKNIILYNDEIFPNDGGVVYEKYISPEPDDHDVGDAPFTNDLDSEVYKSEDDSENMEATAQYDFAARSERELSLKKGDVVTLYAQVSSDWWKGAINGTEGLIPDKYISLKMKDDDRDKMEHLKTSSSEESIRRRASSSNDSMLSEGAMASASPLAQRKPIVWTTVPDTSENVPLKPPDTNITHPREAHFAGKHKSMDASLESYIQGISNFDTIPPHRQSSLSFSSHQSINTAKSSIHLNIQPIDSTQDVPVRISHKSEDISTIPLENPPEPSRSELVEIDNSNLNFNKNREQWQKRANSQGHIKVVPTTPKLGRHAEMGVLRQHHTPDLVMDLPLVGSSSPKETTKKSITMTADVFSDSVQSDSPAETPVESPSGPESPDMSTAAERFAKQNQCTLKKNTKIQIDSGQSDPTSISELMPITSPMHERKFPMVTTNTSTSTFKPQIKSKPPVLKKPVFSVPALPTVPPEVSQNDPEDLSS